MEGVIDVRKIFLVFKAIILVITVPVLMFSLVGCTHNYGEIYTLEEAYEKGILKYDDLLSIAYYNNDGIIYNEALFPSDFKPKLIDNLNKNQIHRIKSTMAKSREEYNSYSIASYYGTYNRAIVFKIDSSLENIPTVETEENVGGIVFHYPSNKIKVYIEN